MDKVLRIQNKEDIISLVNSTEKNENLPDEEGNRALVVQNTHKSIKNKFKTCKTDNSKIARRKHWRKVPDIGLGCCLS